MESEARRAARKSDLFGHDVHDRSQPEHTSDCAYCPICATIAVVRKTRPEVLDHLAAAAKELIVAAGIILEEAGEIVGAATKPETPGEEAQSDDGKVRHIHSI